MWGALCLFSSSSLNRDEALCSRLQQAYSTCSILASLHKLPILFRINFKVLLIVFKPLNGQLPTYITDLLGYTPSPDPSGPQAKDF